MKKTLLLFLYLVATAQFCQAQNTVESIRQRYTAIKDYIAKCTGTNQYDGAEWIEYYHVEVRQMLPATGGHIEDVYMYYDELEEDKVYPPHFLKFVTTKYNYAARNYYDEYLFDQDGQLAFAYIYDPMWSPDENINDQEYEFRFYYNKGKLLQAIVKNKPYDQQASFKEVYSGASPNGAFKSKADYTLQWCGKYRQMFQSIDNLTYDSSY